MSNIPTTKAWLKQQAKQSTVSLRWVTVLGSSNGVLLITQAWLLAWSANQVMFQQANLMHVLPALGALLGLILLRSFLSYATEQVAFKAAAHIRSQLRQKLLGHLFISSPSTISPQAGALSHLLSTGIDALDDYYSRYLPAVSFSALIPLAILIVILPIDWQSGLIFLVTAPLIPFFMIMIGTKAEAMNQERWQSLNRMGNHFLDVIQGLTQLKLFNASRREAQAIAQISDEYRLQTLSVLKVAFLSSFALEFLATISIALVAVIIGFRLYYGTLDFATGFAVLLLAPEFYLPLRNLGTQYHARMQGVSAAEDILHYLQQTPLQATGAEPLLTTPQHIHIQNLSVHYQEQVALNNVSLQINGAGLYALVGKSGAGKTTLIDTLLGFHPSTSGQIKINQQDLTTLSQPDWHKHIAWIPQKPHLFYGTVLDNIALANPEASEEEVIQAAKKTSAHEFIQALPQSYHTTIGEQGTQLSGGQRQRLALARAFLKQAAILLFDEPTAHLDQATEHQIQSAIQHYSQQHIVIVIAQRLRTVEQAKTIFVLDQGELVETGNHHELLKQQGLYAHMLQLGEHND